MNDNPEAVFARFWAPIVVTNGEVDMEKVKKELFDYYNLINTVSVVYEEITGGVLSKTTYTAEEVFSQYRNQLEDERGICRECGEDFVIGQPSREKDK